MKGRNEGKDTKLRCDDREDRRLEVFWICVEGFKETKQNKIKGEMHWWEVLVFRQRYLIFTEVQRHRVFRLGCGEQVCSQPERAGPESRAWA